MIDPRKASLARSLRGAAIGVVLASAILLVRFSAWGRSAERGAEYALGGRRASWVELARVLSCFPVLAFLVTLAAVAMWFVPRWRERSILAVTLLVIGNVGSAVAKRLAALVLPTAHATLPSGHATLALTVAAAIGILSPVGWKKGAWCLSGFIATWGTLGVIAAYWHRPGDAVVSCALLPLWLTSALAVVTLVSPLARHVRRSRPAPASQREHMRQCGLLVGSGSATAVLMLLGWGFEPQTASPLRAMAGLADVVLIPVVVTLLLSSLARVVGGLREPTD